MDRGKVPGLFAAGLWEWLASAGTCAHTALLLVPPFMHVRGASDATNITWAPAARLCMWSGASTASATMGVRNLLVHALVPPPCMQPFVHVRMHTHFPAPLFHSGPPSRKSCRALQNMGTLILLSLIP